MTSLFLFAYLLEQSRSDYINKLSFLYNILIILYYIHNMKNVIYMQIQYSL